MGLFDGLGDGSTSVVSGDVNPKQLHRDTKRAMHCVIQRMNNKLRFETPEELDLLKENFAIARKRSAIGLITASAGSGLVWRYVVGARYAPFAATCT
uniref:Uncharacterized protein n=1 Tax=Globisporangium ultimum (strain ATCC 200006 / CBS 805.95 / DAOM BR144) TaxID=431595 RepID=K3WJ22_GLOUD